MKLSFELSMHGVASWNGRWSGEGRLYAVVKAFTSKKAMAKAQEVLNKRSYHYNWSDGWGARVTVRQVDNAEARRLRIKSDGFCGYEWMIDSILRHGAIYASHEEPKQECPTTDP